MINEGMQADDQENYRVETVIFEGRKYQNQYDSDLIAYEVCPAAPGLCEAKPERKISQAPPANCKCGAAREIWYTPRMK